mgnify:CR=1 FL=1
MTEHHPIFIALKDIYQTIQLDPKENAARLTYLPTRDGDAPTFCHLEDQSGLIWLRCMHTASWVLDEATFIPYLNEVAEQLSHFQITLQCAGADIVLYAHVGEEVLGEYPTLEDKASWMANQMFHFMSLIYSIVEMVCSYSPELKPADLAALTV